VPVNYDLPSGLGNSPIELDDTSGFSLVVPEGSGYQITERISVKRTAYVPLAKGTESNKRIGYYLFIETNFEDIGGGMMSYDRVYRNIPNEWQEIRIDVLQWEQLRSNLTSSWWTQESTRVAVKVRHTYQLNFPTSGNFNVPVIYRSAGQDISAGTAVKPDEAIEYGGNIFEVLKYELLETYTVTEAST